MLNFLFRATNGGKTSLSEQLQLHFTGCRVINMDEYFYVIKVISIECRVESIEDYSLALITLLFTSID